MRQRTLPLLRRRRRMTRAMPILSEPRLTLHDSLRDNRNILRIARLREYMFVTAPCGNLRMRRARSVYLTLLGAVLTTVCQAL